MAVFSGDKHGSLLTKVKLMDVFDGSLNAFQRQGRSDNRWTPTQTPWRC